MQHYGEEIDLASDMLTLPQVMEKLSRRVGRTISYEVLLDEEAESVWGPEVAILFRWLNEVGFSIDIPALEKWGIPLTTFEEHLQTAPWARALAHPIAG